MITKQYILSGLQPDILPDNAGEMQCVFFDIETTGFRAASSRVYLIGAAFCSPSGWRLMQWMSEGGEEEAVLLRTFAAFLRPFEILIHFNGNRFDIPYLQQKYEAYRIPSPLENMRSTDLYQLLRPLRFLLEQDHMNQKSLETLLGISREDRFDGGELIEVYRRYCARPDEDALSALLLHNHEDVTGMLRLTSLIAFRQLLPDAPPPEAIDAQLPESPQSPESLQLTCRFARPFPFSLLRSTASVTLSLSGQSVSLRIRLRAGVMLHFFDNYRDYYYLPREDMAIHKSVAAFVDREFRKPASARTCYVRKEGVFLPVFGDVSEPLFRTSYDARESWILLPPEGLPAPLLETCCRQYLGCFLARP